MKKIDRLKWIASFDMEHLVASILRMGMIVCICLVLAALVIQWFTKGDVSSIGPIQARSIPILLSAVLARIQTPQFWPILLIHLSVAVLLLTPYVRVLASTLYFAYVDRNWKHALLSGVILILLTIILLTDII